MRSFVWILRLLTLSQSRNLATFHRFEIAPPHVKSPSNSASFAAVTPSPAANKIRIITMNNFKKKKLKLYQWPLVKLFVGCV